MADAERSLSDNHMSSNGLVGRTPAIFFPIRCEKGVKKLRLRAGGLAEHRQVTAAADAKYLEAKSNGMESGGSHLVVAM